MSIRYNFSLPWKIVKLGLIEELQDEVKRPKRTQGFDVVRGKRLKPLNYIAGKDKI